MHLIANCPRASCEHPELSIRVPGFWFGRHHIIPPTIQLSIFLFSNIGFAYCLCAEKGLAAQGRAEHRALSFSRGAMQNGSNRQAVMDWRKVGVDLRSEERRVGKECRSRWS